jgi:hypothetical protein
MKSAAMKAALVLWKKSSMPCGPMRLPVLFSNTASGVNSPAT